MVSDSPNATVFKATVLENNGLFSAFERAQLCQKRVGHVLKLLVRWHLREQSTGDGCMS